MCTYVVPVLHEYAGPVASFYIRATTITPTHIHHRCWCLLHQLVHSHGEHACSGTFSPLPVTVNPCAHAMSPLTVVEGSAVPHHLHHVHGCMPGHSESRPSYAFAVFPVAVLAATLRWWCCCCFRRHRALRRTWASLDGAASWCGRHRHYHRVRRWCRRPRGAVASCLRLNSWAWWQRRRSQQLHHCLSSDCWPYEGLHLQ